MAELVLGRPASGWQQGGMVALSATLIKTGSTRKKSTMANFLVMSCPLLRPAVQVAVIVKGATQVDMFIFPRQSTSNPDSYWTYRARSILVKGLEILKVTVVPFCFTIVIGLGTKTGN